MFVKKAQILGIAIIDYIGLKFHINQSLSQETLLISIYCSTNV